MKELTQSTIEKSISNGVSVVMFSAPWCVPCRKVTSTLEEIEKEIKTVKYYKVNIEEHPTISVKYNVSSLPTIVIFKDGVPQSSINGSRDKSIIKEKINEVI